MGGGGKIENDFFPVTASLKNHRFHTPLIGGGVIDSRPIHYHLLVAPPPLMVVINDRLVYAHIHGQIYIDIGPILYTLSLTQEGINRKTEY